MVSLFNTIFIICLVLAIVLLIVTVLLFFVFDIRTIFNIRTGRAASKSIKQLEAINASTGRLRSDKKTSTDSLKKERGGRSKKLKSKTETFGLQTPQAPASQPAPDAPMPAPPKPVPPQPAPKAEDALRAELSDAADDYRTELLGAAEPDAPQTELLDAADDYRTELLGAAEPDAPQTELLDAEDDEDYKTEVLGSGKPGVVTPPDIAPQNTQIRFDVVKKIILCDTDEIIT